MYANAINIKTLVIAAAVAMLLALGGAGIAYANATDSEEQLTGPDAQKAKSAAIDAVGGGTLTEVERDDGDDGYGTSGGYEVEVTREDGSLARFVVDKVERYAKDAFPTAAVYGDSTHRAELRLITCGGAFDDETGHYVDNVVAYAHLV